MDRVEFLEKVVTCAACHAKIFTPHPGSDIPGYHSCEGERCPRCGVQGYLDFASFDPRRASHLAAWSKYYNDADPARWQDEWA